MPVSQRNLTTCLWGGNRCSIPQLTPLKPMRKRLAKITVPSEYRTEKSAKISGSLFFQVMGGFQKLCGHLKLGTKSGVSHQWAFSR